VLDNLHSIEPIIRKFHKCNFFLQFIISVRGEILIRSPLASKTELHHCADKITGTSSDNKIFVCGIMR